MIINFVIPLSLINIIYAKKAAMIEAAKIFIFNNNAVKIPMMKIHA
jgi:hypothetical protein